MKAQHLRHRMVVAVMLMAACATFLESRQAPGIPPRDRRPPQTGTASINGRVIDAATGIPVARARVTLQGPLLQPPSTDTDAGGLFSFANLPAGPYTLNVEKTSYLPSRYPEPGRSVRTAYRPLIVRDRQVVQGFAVPLARAGAIAGRIVDAYGDPVESADVRVMRMPRAGRPGRPMMQMSSSTNDLGEFRLWRLEPGSYVLLVLPRNRHRGESADSQAAPTYYPGVTALDQAQPLTLARGESMTGLELALVESETSLVTGTVMGADAQAFSMGYGYVSARPVLKELTGGWIETAGAGVLPDGSFRLRLAPGEYRLEATVRRPGGGRATEQLFGAVQLAVGGEPMSGVAIVVGSGAKVSGRILFDGKSPVPSNQRLHISFDMREGQPCRHEGRTEVAANWTFSAEGLAGTCAIQVSWVDLWMPKAVLHEGTDLLDRPMTFESGQHYRNVQIVLTDRRTRVAFRVIDERGQETRDYVALVFTVDKARWVHGSRHVRTFVPRQMGTEPAEPPRSVPGAPAHVRRESVTGLPPGEYYVVALDDMDPDDIHDPAVLAQLARAAVRVTLEEGNDLEVAVRRLMATDAAGGPRD